MICGLHDEWGGVGLVVLSGPTWPHGKNPAMRALGVFGVLVSMPSDLKVILILGQSLFAD